MTKENKNPAAAARGSELASDFTQSLHYDRRLYREDIAGSVAHARMLARQDIIPAGDAGKIVEGLRQIEREMEDGTFQWKPELEDIHMNVESRLYEIIGDAAGRLHTARREDGRRQGRRIAPPGGARARRRFQASGQVPPNHRDAALQPYGRERDRNGARHS